VRIHSIRQQIAILIPGVGNAPYIRQAVGNVVGVKRGGRENRLRLAIGVVVGVVRGPRCPDTPSASVVGNALPVYRTAYRIRPKAITIPVILFLADSHNTKRSGHPPSAIC